MNHSFGLALAALVAGASAAPAAAETCQSCRGWGPPQLRGTSLAMEGVGTPGPSYRVRVTLSFRACADRGRMRFRVAESMQLNGLAFARRSATYGRKHGTSGCQRVRLRWNLADRFFGAGEYRATVRAFDGTGRRSRTYTRSIVGND